MNIDKTKLEEREGFIFRETLSELPLEPKDEAQIQKSLFKDFDAEKMMNAYESQLGIKPKEEAAPKIRYCSIQLSPGVDDEDQKLLSDLMNDPELYQIVNRSSYWTPRGEYKLFMEYTENLDIKASRERVQEPVKEEATTNG